MRRNGATILDNVAPAIHRHPPPNRLAYCPIKTLRHRKDQFSTNAISDHERQPGPWASQPNAPKFIARMQMMSGQGLAPCGRKIMPNAEGGLEPDAETQRVTLQGIIRFFIHMLEEQRKFGGTAVERSPHRRGAVWIGGNILPAR